MYNTILQKKKKQSYNNNEKNKKEKQKQNKVSVKQEEKYCDEPDWRTKKLEREQLIILYICT